MLLHNQILPREGSRYTPAQFLALFGAKKFIQRFGTGLSAAYFLADLGSKRGEVFEPDGGAFVSMDGTDDKGINAEVPFVGGQAYTATAWARSTTTGVKRAGEFQFSITVANTWQFISSSAAISPSGNTEINLGWDNLSTFTQSDWSDFKIVRASSGVTVAHWKLNEQSSGSLNGVTAVDSSGNGYDGTHVGGTGGLGAPVAYVNLVSRDRRDSDGGLRAFTAGDIKSGTALDYVNNETSALYGNTMFFSGANTETGHIAGTSSSDPYGFSGKTKIEIRGTFIAGKLSNSQTNVLFSQAVSATNSGVATGITTNNKFRMAGRSVSSDGFTSLEHTTILVVGRAYEYKGYIDFTNDEIGVALREIDSGDSFAYETSLVSFGENTYTPSSPSGNVTFGFLPTTVNTTFNGIAKLTEIWTNDTLVSSYDITSNLASGAEDQTGSVDLTVNGSPALYSGQPFGSVQAKLYDGLAGANDATQATVANMPKTVIAGATVIDGNGNASTLWDGTDELTFTTAFTGLTAANVYAVTDNGGTVTLDTITAFDISGITTMTALLTSLTYTKVTAVIIAPDNANQAAIQSDLNRLYST